MKRLTKISWLLIAITLLALSACGGGGAAATPTVDTAPIYTQIASTALAMQAQTALAVPKATDTPPASSTPEAAQTPLITDTPLPGTPSATPLALKTLKTTSQASCDNMEYVGDVTYPDGYVAYPGENMIKTWTVKNLGPCTWNKDYALVFGWGGVGTDWNTIGRVNLTKVVQPGETIEISVSLTAPKASGDYGAYFVLQNDKGVNFPSTTLTIFIKVQK
jgi:predicted small lipoprotein YifL